MRARGSRGLVVAAFVDLALIVVFAATGRRTHGDGSAVGEVLVVAAPFAIAYAIASAVWRADRGPSEPRRGVVIGVTTAALGLVLRGTLFGRGLAPAFVVVALVTITALLAGWRLVASAIRRARGAAPA